MGAKLRVAAPETFFPVEIAKLYPLKLYYNADEAISGADVVYTLRVQSERGAKGFIPTIREYSKTFGVNARRFALAKKSAILMHPGPVIRDVDIASELMRHERNRILQQVNNGLFIRLALLWLFTQRVDQKTKSFIPA
jgi:aspartate carbamoyltransferase catalytic subunit